MFRTVVLSTAAIGMVDALKCMMQQTESGTASTCAEEECGAGYNACMSYDLGTAPTDATAKTIHDSVVLSLPAFFYYENQGDALLKPKTSGCVKKAEMDAILYLTLGAGEKPDPCTLPASSTLTCDAADDSIDTIRTTMEGKVTYKWKLCSEEKCNASCSAEGTTYSSTTRSAGSILAVAGMALAGFFLA